MKIEIYSDIACPWCYIGERRLSRALAAYPGGDEVAVVYRSFQLDPGAPEAARPLTEHLQEKFGPGVDEMLSRVSDAARGEGLEFDWSRALSVNTLTAHRLLRLAEREYGPQTQRTLVEKLFAAYFSEGRDLADHEVLATLAIEAGMDGARVRDYLSSGEGLEETRSDLDHARRLGIQSVPTFIFEGKFAVQGAQPASVFLKALEEVAARTAEESAKGSANGSAAAGTDRVEARGDGDSEEACADGSCEI